MDIVGLLVGSLIGVITGIFIGKLFLFRHEDGIELSSFVSSLETAKNEASQLGEQVARLSTENQYLKNRETEVTNAIKVHARQLLDNTAKELTETQNTKLENIVDPLNTALKEFRAKIDSEKKEEIEERTTLKGELKSLLEMNQTLSEEAKELTTALKGDQKTQGNWGELKLRKVLEASGLNEGEEFTEQGEGLRLKDNDGKLQQPDFIINLPDNKHLIIDSKISLVAYDRYVNAESEAESAKHLADHLKSVKNHIEDLSGKHYHANKKLVSPEFVFIFMGLEPALILALQNDMAIATTAWEKNIILVSPSLMLASLKSVSSVWKHEKQTKNALEIADKAGGLYDKFVGLIDELQDVGKKMDSAKDSYNIVFSRLSCGTGNLVKKADDIRKLGAKTKKQLDAKLVETSRED